MLPFLETIFARIDGDDDVDGGGAVLELGLLIEFFFARHRPTYEAMARHTIGDAIVDRGITREEVDEALAECIRRLADVPRLSKYILSIMTRGDLRIFSPLLEVLPALVRRDDLESGHRVHH